MSKPSKSIILIHGPPNCPQIAEYLSHRNQNVTDGQTNICTPIYHPLQGGNINISKSYFICLQLSAISLFFMK